MSSESSAEGPSVSESEQVERPSQRIQIGSQRKVAAGESSETAVEEAPKPKPVMPVKTAQPKKEQKHYPPPNIRDQLTPELEAEYLAAIGETSFNDLMDSATTGAPPTEI